VLTEAALHFGRRKREKQAVMLAQRYTRYKELLPKAVAALQQLLDGLDKTPEPERLQFIQHCRDELRAMAQGEALHLCWHVASNFVDGNAC
jgi:hypothetical protein